jgi:hypothetical protein
MVRETQNSILSFPTKLKHVVINNSIILNELKTIKNEAHDIIYNIKETSSFLNDSLVYYLETNDPICKDLAVSYFDTVKDELFRLKLLLKHYESYKKENNVNDIILDAFVKDLKVIELDLMFIGEGLNE